MRMAVMQVGIVGMPVDQADMLVPVAMRLTGGIVGAMRVLVMRVVDVAVRVLHRFVDVIMLVALAEMKP